MAVLGHPPVRAAASLLLVCMTCRHPLMLDAKSGYTSGSMNVEVTMDNRDEVAAKKTVSVALLAPDGNEVAKKNVVFDFKAGETE